MSRKLDAKIEDDYKEKTNAAKLNQRITKAFLNKKIYEQFNNWEKNFIRSLSAQFERTATFSIKQKEVLIPIFKKYNL